MSFLPATPADLASAGLSPGGLDAVIVTGDAYVDHSSFGAAIIGRTLEAAGYKVGILARPDPDDVSVFRLLGRPKLAFLVTAGAVDSMVSSYTANKKPRSEDEYAPGGDPRLCLRADGSIGTGLKSRTNARPDRATIVYANLCRQAYKGIALVIGGIEASLRRLTHYDYWSDGMRKSILLDSKADILVYGMGESQILAIMARLKAGASDLRGIRGTVWAVHRDPTEQRELKNLFPGALILPDSASISGADPDSKLKYAESFALQYRNTDPHVGRPLVEPCGDRFVVQEPPAFPLDKEELDRVCALHYERNPHHLYGRFGGVPALAEVKFSLLSSRGCFGGCSFCALTFHQGRDISSRSKEAIVREARLLSALPDFKGYIHDVGGPTANFRFSACEKMEKRGACADRLCLSPEPCPNLKADHHEYLEILRELRSLPGIRKVFVRSGVRYDYAMLDPKGDFLEELVEHHVSGQLKVAPEHVSDKVLALMGKPSRRSYDAFAARYAELNRKAGLKQYLIPYFISAHPGSGLPEAIELAEYLRDTGFVPDQVQDFYPTPGTLSTAMWRTGVNPLDGKPVYVARGAHERALQRALLQFKAPANADLVREALTLAGRADLIGFGPRCLVGPGPSAAGRRPSNLSSRS
ncbi:MAG: YgiQ family radical SAM protein [Spirochaetes bacterium]|nr:YgiQ family radical SAM protein [Spirochaetota bacterium]